jgi:transcriptional regulator with XRE-family HTH domain
MNRSNVIGPSIAKLRNERKWTQEMLAAKLQIQGCDITRDVIANIESRRSPVTDKQILHFMRVFQVPLTEIFPSDVSTAEPTKTWQF